MNRRILWSEIKQEKIIRWRLCSLIKMLSLNYMTTMAMMYLLMSLLMSLVWWSILIKLFSQSHWRKDSWSTWPEQQDGDIKQGIWRRTTLGRRDSKGNCILSDEEKERKIVQWKHCQGKRRGYKTSCDCESFPHFSLDDSFAPVSRANSLFLYLQNNFSTISWSSRFQKAFQKAVQKAVQKAWQEEGLSITIASWILHRTTLFQVCFDDYIMNDDRGNSPGGRRQSFTEKMFGGAREWFQANRSISNPGASPIQMGSSPPTAGGHDMDGNRSRSRSLSNSYMFNHHRDLIIPGPVF